MSIYSIVVMDRADCTVWAKYVWEVYVYRRSSTLKTFIYHSEGSLKSAYEFRYCCGAWRLRDRSCPRRVQFRRVWTPLRDPLDCSALEKTRRGLASRFAAMSNADVCFQLSVIENTAPDLLRRTRCPNGVPRNLRCCQRH